MSERSSYVIVSSTTEAPHSTNGARPCWTGPAQVDNTTGRGPRTSDGHTPGVKRPLRAQKKAPQVDDLEGQAEPVGLEPTSPLGRTTRAC